MIGLDEKLDWLTTQMWYYMMPLADISSIFEFTQSVPSIFRQG